MNMKASRYRLWWRLVICEHFNARQGDISQTGVVQANGEVSRPANVAGRESMLGYTRNTMKSGSMRDECSLVWTRRGGTRSETAARGRGERRRGGASCRDTQIIMKEVATRAIRAPAQVVLKVLAGRPGALFEHFARDGVRSHWSARGTNSGVGSLEGLGVVRCPVSPERRGIRLGLNAVWMPKYKLRQIRIRRVRRHLHRLSLKCSSGYWELSTSTQEDQVAMPVARVVGVGGLEGNLSQGRRGRMTIL
ncbi:hypothetical protein V8E52_009396 [Russula decolorans]